MRKRRVDGGINKARARMCVEAGANVLCAGAAVFNDNQPIEQSVTELRAAALGKL